MEVGHALLGCLAVGPQDVHPIIAAGIYIIFRHPLGGVQHLGRGFHRAVQQAFRVGLGDDQGVALCVPGDVQKGQGGVVLVNFIAGGLPLGDGAEHAVLHGLGGLPGGEGPGLQQGGVGGGGQLGGLQPGDEPAEEPPALAPAFQAHHAQGGEHHRPHKIHQQVLHGVVEADVQIGGPILAVDRYAVHHHLDGGVFAIGVQGHSAEGLHPGILLHIHAKKAVHGVLEELPHHPGGHGEAEGHQGHKGGGEAHLEFVRAVEDVHHGHADGRHQKAVHGVEHGVPEGEDEVILLDLPQNLRGEDKQQDDDLQGVGHLDVQPVLHKGGDKEQDQGQPAEEHVVIIPFQGLQHHYRQHQQPQHKIGGGELGVLLGLAAYRGEFLPAPGLALLLGGPCFLIVRHSLLLFLLEILPVLPHKVPPHVPQVLRLVGGGEFLRRHIQTQEHVRKIHEHIAHLL